MGRKGRNTYYLELANGQHETVHCTGLIQEQFTGIGAYALFAEFETSDERTLVIGGSSIVSAEKLN
ncbi:hypothetical protein [Arthrobacter castelli]|uniref:hypothetical protein n=1 Tax=Arthrobacter castelli TaxID=271431 RepID=UPI00040C3B7B|nr:hypothetical protein [Arthrobacter castelli]